MIYAHYRLMFLLICSLLINNGLLIAGQKSNVPNLKSNRPSSSKSVVCTNPKLCTREDTSDGEDDDRIKFVEPPRTPKPAGGGNMPKPTGGGNTPKPMSDGNTQLKFKNNDFAPITFRKPPTGCDTSTFCTDVRDYPKYMVNTLIKSKVPRDIFYSDVIDDTLPKFGKEEALCSTDLQVMYPQAAKSKSDTWKYIVQSTDDNALKQGVRVEICRSENTSCGFNPQTVPNGHATMCVQKYIYRRLMALETNGEPGYDDFKIPSCCECMYTSVPV